MNTHADSQICELCGAPLDVPITFGVDIAFVSGNGTPTERVLSVQGREVHRCQTRPAKRP